MDLDDEAVGPAGGGGHGHRRDQAVDAGGVAGVHDDGQVGELVEHGHGGEVQGVAGVVVKGADAPLAKDDLLIAAGHDVLGAHQELFEGVGEAPLEEDGLIRLAQLPEEVEVLHVPGPHLQDVHILKERQVHDAHDLRHDGKAGLLPGDLQKLQALGLQAGEIIGGGPGLEGAAPEHVRPGGLHGLGHGHDLLLRLHGAGARHHAEVAAADLDVSHLHHGVLGVELPVAALEGLRHPLHGVHDAKAPDEVHIHSRGVAHQAQHRLILALGDVHLQALLRQPVDELGPLFLFHAAFQYHDHCSFPPSFR